MLSLVTALFSKSLGCQNTREDTTKQTCFSVKASVHLESPTAARGTP